jgi:hypothetical protein
MFIADHDLKYFDNLEHGKSLSDQHTRTAIDDTRQGWKGAKGRQQLLDGRSYGLIHFILIHTVSFTVINMFYLRNASSCTYTRSSSSSSSLSHRML